MNNKIRQSDYRTSKDGEIKGIIQYFDIKIPLFVKLFGKYIADEETEFESGNRIIYSYKKLFKKVYIIKETTIIVDENAPEYLTGFRNKLELLKSDKQ